ncbi:hypothetical protein HMPREF1989_01944, partial [Porphyromonas gingivalis F0566]
DLVFLLQRTALMLIQQTYALLGIAFRFSIFVATHSFSKGCAGENVTGNSFQI